MLLGRYKLIMSDTGSDSDMVLYLGGESHQNVPEISEKSLQYHMIESLSPLHEN